MTDSRLFDAAKKATELVTSKASELTQSSAETTESLRDIAAGVKAQMPDATPEMKGTGLAKLDEALDDFNAALPVLREVGYVVEGVSVKLGLVPQVVANFSTGTLVSEERINALLNEHAGRKLTT